MRRRGDRLHGIRILHEDADVIVIEKAAGILTQATRRGDAYSVEDALTDYVRKGQWKSARRVYLVHRLDRETSGVMMVAKTEAVQDYFRSNWNALTTKIYLARVAGTLPAPAGVFESYLREDENYVVQSVRNPRYGKYARTDWRLAEGPVPNGEGPIPRATTLVEVTLKSGRKNQIRVHFAEAGHPVVGDVKYGWGQTPPGRGQAPKRGQTLCLHAWKLAFIHPRTRERMLFETVRPRFAEVRPAAR